jgi:peptide/nickel transport system permease protein
LIGLVLSYWLGYRLSLLPIAGYCNFFGAQSRYDDCGGPVDWIYHLLLPGFVFALPLTAYYTVVTRRLLRRVSERMAGRTGAGEETLAVARRCARAEFGKRVLRTTCLLVGTTVFVESIFNLHGFGQGMITAVNQGDGPAAEAILVCATLAAVGIYVVVDLAVAAVLPAWRRLVP